MKTIHPIILLTLLGSFALVGRTEADNWKFGQPVLRDDNIRMLIPLVLEPATPVLQNEALEVNKYSGKMSYGDLGDDGKLHESSTFHLDIANTNELKNLMDNYMAWKKQIPEKRTYSTGEMNRLYPYSRVNYTDENGKWLMEFENEEIVSFDGKSRRIVDRMKCSPEKGYGRRINDPSALIFILASLDKIQPMFQNELARKTSRETAMTEIRQKQIAGELAAAKAVANKELADAKMDAKDRSRQAQKEKEFARIKKENEEARAQVDKQETLKQRAKIATFLTSKQGGELKTKIDNLTKSITDRHNRERAYLVKIGQAMSEMSINVTFGKATKNDLQMAVNNYVIAEANHKDSSELQKERANLKILLDEFKKQLGVPYDDAMHEMASVTPTAP
jgi:hypothetical protein